MSDDSEKSNTPTTASHIEAKVDRSVLCFAIGQVVFNVPRRKTYRDRLTEALPDTPASEVDALCKSSKSSGHVWRAWRFGYFAWDHGQARLRDTSNWTHRLMMLGLLIGTALASIDLMQVLMVGSPTGKWLAVSSAFSLRLLVLLTALEWLVLSPRRVSHALRATTS